MSGPELSGSNLRLAVPAPDAAPSLLACLAEYAATLQLDQAYRTWKEIDYAVRRAAKSQGWLAVTDMTTASVREYLLALKSKGRARKTLKLYRDALDGFGAWCAKRKDLPSNPLDGIPHIRVRRKGKPPARIVPPLSDVLKLVNFLRSPDRARQKKDRWKCVLCAASQPLRRSAWKFLEWPMVVLDGAHPPHLDIPPELVRAGRVLRLTKNGQRRIEWLTPEVAALLREHRASAGSRVRVFQSVPDPEQFTKDASRAGCRMLDNATGATFAFHSLKHFASNRRLALGWTIEERTMANDHSDQRITLDTYTDPAQVGVAARTSAMPPILIIGTPKSRCREGGFSKDSAQQAVLGLTKGVTVADTAHAENMMPPTFHPDATTVARSASPEVIVSQQPLSDRAAERSTAGLRENPSTASEWAILGSNQSPDSARVAAVHEAVRGLNAAIALLAGQVRP